MSGPDAKGAKQRARVFQDGKATIQGGVIQRKGLVDVDKKLIRKSRKVLIGLRVRNDQDIVSLRLWGKKGTVEIPVTREPAGGTISTQLDVVAPAPGEQWIGFVSDYKKNQHGTNGFRTDIQVSNFTATANGFQEIPVAFTYKDPAGNEFTNGHYVVTTSILPGQAADPEPTPEEPPEATNKKSAKAAKKTAKAAKKTAKKSKARGKKKAGRKKR
jgi:hypothetical protein